MMREAVAHKTELSTLDVLLDGVEEFLLGDFHLCVGPTGNLDDHVEDGVVGDICKELNVMPWRNDRLLLGDKVFLLSINAVFYQGAKAFSDEAKCS